LAYFDFFSAEEKLKSCIFTRRMETCQAGREAVPQLLLRDSEFAALGLYVCRNVRASASAAGLARSAAVVAARHMHVLQGAQVTWQAATAKLAALTA